MPLKIISSIIHHPLVSVCSDSLLSHVFDSSPLILARLMLYILASRLILATCKESLIFGRQSLPGCGNFCLIKRQFLPLAWNVLRNFPRKSL